MNLNALYGSKHAKAHWYLLKIFNTLVGVITDQFFAIEMKLSYMNLDALYGSSLVKPLPNFNLPMITVYKPFSQQHLKFMTMGLCFYLLLMYRCVKMLTL